MSGTDEVRAAGAVPWRRLADGSVELAVVHRPRYDDWSFPKGKLEPGESFADGARREVAEETGLVGELGASLPESRYVDHRGRSKVVRWWLLEVRSDPGSSSADAGALPPGAVPHGAVPNGAVPNGAVPNEEVDELRWLSPGEAVQLVGYVADVRLAMVASRLLRSS